MVLCCIKPVHRSFISSGSFGEERVAVGFDDQWITISSMADRAPILTADKNGQRRFSQMIWINKRPAKSITAQVTP